MADKNQATNNAKIAKDVADNAGNAGGEAAGATISGAIKLAQSAPTVATLAGGIGLGAGAIAAKNIIGNATGALAR